MGMEWPKAFKELQILSKDYKFGMKKKKTYFLEKDFKNLSRQQGLVFSDRPGQAWTEPNLYILQKIARFWFRKHFLT